MLSRNGARQPLHRHRREDFASDAERICSLCEHIPFGPAASSAYRDAWISKPRKVSFAYNRLANELRNSALEHCPWCELIAEAITVSLNSDKAMELMASMQGSSSDGDSIFEGQEEASEDIDKDEDMSGNDDHEENGGAVRVEPIEEYLQRRPQFLDDLAGYPSEEQSRERCGKYSSLESASICHINLSYVRQEMKQQSYDILEVSVTIDSAQASDPLAGLAGENAVEFTCNLDAEEGKYNRTSINIQLLIDNLGSLAAKFVSARPYSTSLSLDATTDQAKKWLRCCQDHVTCPRVANFFTPTRVIDLSDMTKPRLHIAMLGKERFEYVALSYVWGMNQSYVTTMDTIKEKTSILDNMLIPSTIAHAMAVTRALGYRYLWVDSLCIIQDSKEDKQHEISQMRLIYQNAAITIAAALSASAADGFLNRDNPRRYYLEPFVIPFFSPTGEISTATVSYKEDYLRRRDPWNSRAWTLEEQLLSPRLLLYTYDGLKWLCKDRAFAGKDDDGMAAPESFFVLPWKGAHHSHGLESTEFRELWCNIRDEYVERAVTHAKDKLVAFAAVAEEFHRVGGGEYLAGLWREHLFTDLQWQREWNPDKTQLKERPRSYRAPSWSWAAVDGHIVWGDLPTTPAFSTVVDCTIKLESPVLPFGPVIDGELTIKGPLAHGIWSYSDRTSRFCDGFVLSAGPDGEIINVLAEANLDALEPLLEDGHSVFCLPLAIAHGISDEVQGLIVLPTSSEKYRRVGFFTGCQVHLNRNSFSTLELINLTIV